MKHVVINTEFITLGQFLKYMNIIESGSQAKIFLASNEILVNDCVETRRGRKLYPNDTIICHNTKYIIEKDV